MVQRIAISLVSDGSRCFRSDAMQQQPKSRQVMNLVKKIFFQKNEDVFVISEKLKYTPRRRPSTSWRLRNSSSGS